MNLNSYGTSDSEKRQILITIIENTFSFNCIEKDGYIRIERWYNTHFVIYPSFVINR